MPQGDSLLRILVIDDEKEFAQGLAEILIERGYIATAAWQESRISALIRRTDFDAVFLDIMMPKYRGITTFGGLGVMMDIATYCPEKRVILFSNQATAEQVVECLKRGALDFVRKPVSPGDLDNLVDRLMLRMRAPGLVHDQVGLRETLIRSLWDNIKTGSAQDRGARLEQLVYHIFKSIPGFDDAKLGVTYGPDQIDIEVANERMEPFWIRRGDVFFVECKNVDENTSIERKELDAFASKLSRSGGRCKLGFFVSWSGVSKGFRSVASELVGVEVISLDRDDLATLVESNIAGRIEALTERVKLMRNVRSGR
jgi:CheY-like chemotaxis protein